MAESSTPRQPVQIPTDTQAFNRALIAEYRASGGKLSGPMAGRSLLLLTTTGAKSGKPSTTVLGYGKDGEAYVAIASNNAAAAHPAWYTNLLANSAATVEVGPEKLPVRARTARPEERDHLAKAVPWFDSQQKLTDREIPIVVFEPTIG